MRKSEKILIAFLTTGILSLSTLIVWKLAVQPVNKPQAASQSQSVTDTSASNTGTKGNSIPVSSEPYYGVGVVGQKPQGLQSPNDNSVEKAPVSEDDSSRSQQNENSSDENNLNTNAVDTLVEETGIMGSANPPPVINKNSNNNSNSNNNDSDSNINPNVNTNTNENSSSGFSFAVIGDSQAFNASDSNDSLRKAVANIAKANVNVVLSVGDLISSCDGGDSCAKKYESWKQIMQPILGITKEVQGNHDRTGKENADKIWQTEFDLPTNGPAGYSELTYSFDYGNTHFVALDSEKPKESTIGQDQREWLENDLSANKKENTFVFYHEPAYPVSSKIDESLDVHKEDRDALWSIFKNHNVTAVFSGHEHIMSRKSIDGLYQFVIGNTDMSDHDAPKPGMAEYSYVGHHYAIVSVKGKEIIVKIYTVDGNLLNSFTLPR